MVQDYMVMKHTGDMVLDHKSRLNIAKKAPWMAKRKGMFVKKGREVPLLGEIHYVSQIFK